MKKNKTRNWDLVGVYTVTSFAHFAQNIYTQRTILTSAVHSVVYIFFSANIRAYESQEKKYTAWFLYQRLTVSCIVVHSHEYLYKSATPPSSLDLYSFVALPYRRWKKTINFKIRIIEWPYKTFLYPLSSWFKQWLY